MDDIIGQVDEGVILPPAPKTFTGQPLTWAEIAALAQELPPLVRNAPAVLYVPERLPHVSSYTLVWVNPLGVATADVLPI